MQRGELWTLQDKGYASKARPVLVIQDEDFAQFDSVVLCLLTSYDSEEIVSRVKIEPMPENGLRSVSYVMTDKIVTVDKKLLGQSIGALNEAELARVNEVLALTLGITSKE